jgi:type II secretion system protein G
MTWLLSRPVALLRFARGAWRAFTLIELLVVVAVLAILAAIAIPNLLEAQIRSKVSRARADMRSLATALESYCVDNGRYPPNVLHEGVRVAPEMLTTPMAYITSIPHDPFRTEREGDRLRRYEYHNVLEQVQSGAWGWPPNDLRRYGMWRFTSLGPQREYMPWIPYDATNGTVSAGNILRTQASPDGSIPFVYWDPAQPNI